MARWPLTGLTVIHRFGRITAGENIVLVVTSSQHRQAAFQAAEFLMDYLKANAPFWKREESADRTSWVDARHHDEDAAARGPKPGWGAAPTRRRSAAAPRHCRKCPWANS